MKLHHLSAASLCPVARRLVNGDGGVFEAGRMVCHAWLIESNDGLVLVDTGLGKDDLAHPRERLGTWFQHICRPDLDPVETAWGQIERLGFDPRDVRHIVPTHLDLDHAGGIPDFPNATVHVYRPEYESAMARPTLKEKNRYRPMHWAHEPRWDVRDTEGEAWFGFGSVTAIDRQEEILLVPLLGHTRGHVGVAARVDGGWKLHAGDAYFFHEEMSPTPRCTPGLAVFQRLAVTNNAQRLANQQKLRALVAEHGSEVTVHSAHCPVEFDRLVASSPHAGLRVPTAGDGPVGRAS